MNRNRAYLPVILAAALLVPLAAAITFIGPTNFVGPHGGNVTFSQTFTATTLDYSTGLNTFHSLRWGGAPIGTMGFDVDAGDNMTVTNIAVNQVNYAVTGASVSYVCFIGAGPPTEVIGGTHVYDAVNQTVIVTTAGAGAVVVRWATERTGLYNNLLVYIGLAALIPAIAAIGYIWTVYETGNFDPKVAALIAGIVVAFVIIAAMMSRFV